MARRAKRDSNEIAEDFLAVGRQLGAATVSFNNAVAELARLNRTDWECLDVLDAEGPCPAGRLAEQTGLTTGAITGVLDRLEAAGFVERRRDLDDRRRVIVHPTGDNPRAELLWRHAFAPLTEAMQDLVARTDDRDLEAFTALATNVTELLRRITVQVREAAD